MVTLGNAHSRGAQGTNHGMTVLQGTQLPIIMCSGTPGEKKNNKKKKERKHISR